MASGSASPRATVVPRAGVDGGDASPRVVAGLPRVADDPGRRSARRGGGVSRVPPRVRQVHVPAVLHAVLRPRVLQVARRAVRRELPRRATRRRLARPHRGRRGEAADGVDPREAPPTRGRGPGRRLRGRPDRARRRRRRRRLPRLLLRVRPGGVRPVRGEPREARARGGSRPLDLDPETRARFERAAAAGELSHMVEPWTAWWTLEEARRIHLARDGTNAIVDRTPRADDDDDRATEREDATASEPAPGLSRRPRRIRSRRRRDSPPRRRRRSSDGTSSTSSRRTP